MVRAWRPQVFSPQTLLIILPLELIRLVGVETIVSTNGYRSNLHNVKVPVYKCETTSVCLCVNMVKQSLKCYIKG